MVASQTKPRVLKPRSGEAKYVGVEPTWDKEFEGESDRRISMMHALNWYNYNHDIKESRQCLAEWLIKNDRKEDAETILSGSNTSYKVVAGWLARMSTLGFTINDREKAVIEEVVTEALKERQTTENERKDTTKKPTIQDRLNQSALEAGGEIEGMLDRLIENGVKMDASYTPIDALNLYNVVPQKLPLITDHWDEFIAEMNAVQKGEDPDLNEGYSNFSKIDIRNLIKFADKVIADCHSYAQMKKLSRSPRKKKAVSPEKRVAKFKYLKEYKDLKLTSVSPTKLVDAKEAWLYDTKKRKIIHVTPDPLIKTFTVKGSSIIGFNPETTCQKTLRKPQEQLAEFKKCSAPDARKWFSNIKATEIKFNGRGNENLILLVIR